MKKLVVNALVSAALVGPAAFGPALAEDPPLPSPGVMSQVMLSEQLVAIGMDRNDPILLLAAMRLRGALDDKMYSAGDQFTGEEAMLEAAKAAAAGQDDMMGLIEDAAAEKSRRNCFPYPTSYGVRLCY
ncbi:MAG: hypothetical protein AAF666_00630 [Pseudomonadota bacterium]